MEEVLTLCAPSAWASIGAPKVEKEELGEREKGWVEVAGKAVFASMQVQMYQQQQMQMQMGGIGGGGEYGGAEQGGS